MIASWVTNHPVLMPIVWFVKDMKSNLEASWICTHDLWICSGMFYHWNMLPPYLSCGRLLFLTSTRLFINITQK